jgi:N-methylhydantoinase B
MGFDKAELQIFANYCIAAAESMAYTLMRTAHSTFVKETEDFSCVIIAPDGLAAASPKTLGATWNIGLDFAPVLSAFDDYAPGDVCLTNDPYSGFVATHTPDVMMWKPVFHDGRLMCFVGGHIHNTDMGGAVPASLSRSLTEVHQEGIRFPPTKIVRAGVIDEALLTIMSVNVRAPEQNRGDLQAQLACLATGERKMLEIIDRFGAGKFSAGLDALFDYSEQQARAIGRTIPDGEYFFADYADEDSVGGRPMRVALTLTVSDGLLEFDFTGSDPQLMSSLNMPTGGRERHILPLVGLNYVLYSLNPSLLLNAGMLRIARCILPEGTVVNPQHPAAVGMRSLTSAICQQVTFGAFSLAAPDRMPACPCTGITILNVRTTDRHGKTVMASIGPIGGGAGGSAQGDGSDGSGANLAFLRNTPVEINEAEVPIQIRRYGMARGSAGAGKCRGGLGTLMEFKVFSPNTLVTARNRNGTVFGAWGVAGGGPGGTSVFVRNPGTAREVQLGNTDLVACDPGDVVSCRGGGGGGYGQAYERDPRKVLEDFRCGVIDHDAARADYGVVFSGDAVDAEATTRLRSGRETGRAAGHFRHGAGRLAHEKIWTRARYAVLTERLAAQPVSWRFFLKHKAFEKLELRIANGQASRGPEIVGEIFDELVAEYPALAPLSSADASLVHDL